MSRLLFALIALFASCAQPAVALDLDKFNPLPDRYAACEPIRDDIRDAARRYIPQFPHEATLMAQTYQESLCRLDAVSPAGARGPMQIMPGTEGDLARKFGRFNVFSRQAIAMGARYQSARMRTWSGRNRPVVEQWRLGLASYNAGTGHILNAQSACGGARDWRYIETCLPLITGHHARETRTYVRRIERWALELDPSLCLRGLS